MNKENKYRLIKDYPRREIGDIIDYDNKTSLWFWDKGGAVPECFFPGVEEWFEEVIELEVPIGTKFIHCDEPNVIYTIDSVKDKSVKIIWYWDGYNSLKYSIKFINKHFKDGTWIKYEESEENYKILTVKDKIGLTWTCIENSSFGSSYQGDVFYCNGGAIRGFEILEGIKEDKYLIYSVKRLSDSEVFTIGDRVEYKAGGTWRENSRSIINEFIIRFSDNKLMISTNKSKNWWAPLSDEVRKVKSLFTTEDGVDIFEGDFVYIIPSANKIEYIKQQSYKNDWGSNKSSYFKVFSTEKAAKNYIKCNKPVFSYREVLELYKELAEPLVVGDGDILLSNKFKEGLDKLVKEKLK